MSNRFNNKKLLYLLAVLIVLLCVTILIKIPKEKATFKAKLIEFDTTQVNKIILYPRITDGKPFEFVNTQGKWNIQQGNIISVPEKDAVRNFMLDVLNIKPQNLASVDKSKWKEFDLTDSLAIRIKFLDKKGKVLADLMIGKFSYKPGDNPNAGYGGNNVQGTSFVRLYNEKEVYGVDGFLTFSFGGKFNDYRDKSFLKLSKSDITKIKFTYPADSSYTLNQKDSVWYAGNKVADSLITANFINSLGFLNGQDIKDNYREVSAPVYQINIEGKNLLNITVKCFTGEQADEYILNSNFNPEMYYTSRKNGLFDQVFKPQRFFFKQAKKK
jgi:hypothetical protein